MKIKEIYNKIKKKRKIKYWEKQKEWTERYCSRAVQDQICSRECEDCAWGRIMEDADEALGIN